MKCLFVLHCIVKVIVSRGKFQSFSHFLSLTTHCSDNPSHCMLDRPSPNAILLLAHTPRCSAYIDTQMILVALVVYAEHESIKKPVVPSVVLLLDDVLS